MACCHRMKKGKRHRQTEVWSSACAFDVLYGSQECVILLENFLTVDDVDTLARVVYTTASEVVNR